MFNETSSSFISSISFTLLIHSHVGVTASALQAFPLVHTYINSSFTLVIFFFLTEPPSFPVPFLSFAILTSMLTCPAIQVIYVDRTVGMSSPVRHCLTAEANLLQGCQSFRKRVWVRGNAESVDGSWMKFSLIWWETVESFEWSCTGTLQFSCWWGIQAVLFSPIYLLKSGHILTRPKKVFPC